MGKEVSLGPTGENVRANVKWFREDWRWSYAELSRRLEEIGRPIPPLGLRRLEAGERRVDVDDLVALAAVLEVEPLRLLGDLSQSRGELKAEFGQEWRDQVRDEIRALVQEELRAKDQGEAAEQPEGR